MSRAPRAPYSFPRVLARRGHAFSSLARIGSAPVRDL